MPKNRKTPVCRAGSALFYERVKYLCSHTAAEAEREPTLLLTHGSASRLRQKIRSLGLDLRKVLECTPGSLAEKYFPAGGAQGGKTGTRGGVSWLAPDFALMSREYMRSCEHGGGSTDKKLELRRKVIYEDVYCSEENRRICEKEHRTFYSLSSFNRLWRQYEKSCIAPTFRRKENPGAVCEFDFTGVTMRCADGTKAQFAVMVLAHSRKIYVEAIPSQSAADSAMAIVHGFKSFGGVTETLRIDNFKAAVTFAGRWGGEFTAAYRMLSQFLGFTLSSMPVRSGWLKGHAEAAVKIVTHTLIARMKKLERDRGAFPDIPHMNDWLLRNLDLVNGHPVRGLQASRNEIFERDERQALMPVANWDFHVCDIKTLRVPPTARIELNGHSYCLPARLIGRTVQLEIRPGIVVFYEEGRPLCTYKRLDGTAGVSTKKGWTPPHHLFAEVLRAVPCVMYLEWAGAVGPETLSRVRRILSGSVNIDKLRRAVKLLSLPHERPECYKVFESFLRSQPRSAGVSRLALLWKSWPGKPDGGPADPVYRFGRLFELGEAKLYGEDVKMSWDHPPAQPARPRKKGTVFLNWRGPGEDRAAGGDPITDKGGDPAASDAGDPAAFKQNDPITDTGDERS